MEGRSYTSASYRYGFNGKENDPETVGTGEGLQDYGMRIYNSNLGRFLSVDPLTRQYALYSPYQFAGNQSIRCIDLEGAEEFSRIEYYYNGVLFYTSTAYVLPDNRVKLNGVRQDEGTIVKRVDITSYADLLAFDPSNLGTNDPAKWKGARDYNVNDITKDPNVVPAETQKKLRARAAATQTVSSSNSSTSQESNTTQPSIGGFEQQILDITFQSGSSSIADIQKSYAEPAVQAKIDIIVAVMSKYPAYQLSVEGNADASSASTYTKKNADNPYNSGNEALSWDRAAAFKDFLVAKAKKDTGKDITSQITLKSAGDSNASVSAEASTSARSKDRNIHIEFNVIRRGQ